MKTGFGLAPIKQEGMSNAPWHPHIVWDGLQEQFSEYAQAKWQKWYLKPLRGYLREVAREAWASALHVNAIR